VQKTLFYDFNERLLFPLFRFVSFYLTHPFFYCLYCNEFILSPFYYYCFYILGPIGTIQCILLSPSQHRPKVSLMGPPKFRGYQPQSLLSTWMSRAGSNRVEAFIASSLNLGSEFYIMRKAVHALISLAICRSKTPKGD
jgi:hypothetical protein